jgi:hypothetical protein
MKGTHQTLLPGAARSSSNIPWQPTDDDLRTHFVTVTCETMLTQDKHIWAGAVPRYADANPFLAHAVLACSALHLASKYPSEQGYLMSAHSHQNTAMGLFRKAIVRVTEHNCHAIVAFSHLLIVFSLGTEQHDEHLLLTDASSADPQLVCNWLYFIRNACTMVRDQKDCIFSGPLRRLAECWDPAAAEVDETLLGEMTERLLRASTIGTNDIRSASDTAALEDAARRLGLAFAACEALGEGFTVWDAVRVWPMVVSMDYIRLLRQGNPAAMILMGHYCVLLKELQSMWFIGLYPLRLLYTIKRKLEPELHHHIDPLLEIWNIVF